jgi:hypothetical protein
MKKFIIFPIILFSFFLLNCEKDDICEESTPTTPRLVINFYDADDPTVLKPVTQLAILAEGFSNSVGVYNGVSTVSIPLKTNELTTRYNFIFNSTDTDNDNWDTVEFNYSTNNVYISRACGFKSNFTLDETNPIVLTDAGTLDGLWIESISVNQPNIQNEDETHVNIYF